MLGHYFRAPMRKARLFVVLLSLGFALVAARGGMAQPAAVRVSPIVNRPIIASRTFIGSAEPTRTSIVGSAVDGRVVTVEKEEGDYVTEGELLVSLRTGTVEIALRAAQAELALRQHELEEMTNGSRPEEIAQAQADYAAAEALWEYARSALERTEQLYERGQTISRDEYEERLSVANAARQRLLSAQAHLELVQTGVRQEQIAQAQSRVDAAQAEVDRIGDLLEKYTIEAPFNGYVITKHTEVGQWIQSGEAVIEMVQVDPIDIEVDVPEVYISNVEIGSDATVRFESLGGQSLEGTISRIVPRADEQSRTFPVLVRLANPAGTVKAGMLAEVTLAVDRRDAALLVPKDSLVLGGPTPMVFVVVASQGETHTVRPVPVTTGLESGGMIQVTGEIEEGQLVVVEGNERIFGTTVTFGEADIIQNPE